MFPMMWNNVALMMLCPVFDLCFSSISSCPQLFLQSPVLLVWLLEFLEVQEESRPYGGPLAQNPIWRTVPARSRRAGALENAAEPDRPSGSAELPPAKTLKVNEDESEQRWLVLLVRLLTQVTAAKNHFPTDLHTSNCKQDSFDSRSISDFHFTSWLGSSEVKCSGLIKCPRTSATGRRCAQNIWR